jgi:hypothetical protein
MWKRLLFAGLLFIPAVTWAVFKPIRVVAPEWVGGISCISAKICAEDVSRSGEAISLYRDAVNSVASAVGPFLDEPVVVFCATMDCARSFGFRKAAAIAIGKFGIVVGPRGWKPYYLRHEMIHHRQAEELGVLRQWRSPEWFKEGMAYSLSEDPRQPLTEPWQQYRTEFETWYEGVGNGHLWEEARKL